MRLSLLSILRCPACRGRLSVTAPEIVDEEVERATLTCACGATFPVVEGVPRILRADTVADPVTIEVDRVREGFSFKWGRLPRWGFDRAQVRTFNRRWFWAKLGCQTEEDFRALVASRKAILDAGTGLGGKVAYLAEVNPTALLVGVDFSECVQPARQNVVGFGNAHIVQADLSRLPFEPEGFDLIVCDGVLHHTPNPAGHFRALCDHLAPGGLIAVHVYRRMGPIREFCDDLLRAHCVQLTPEAAWEFSLPFTRLGRALAELGVTIEVPDDIPALGIRGGRYDLQRFLYLHVFKCYWNPAFDFDENNMVNFDWYHPAIASRHTEEEVVRWFEAAGLVDIRRPLANENGVSVVGRRTP